MPVTQKCQGDVMYLLLALWLFREIWKEKRSKRREMYERVAQKLRRTLTRVRQQANGTGTRE